MRLRYLGLALALLIALPHAARAERSTPRDVMLVLDNSGSMRTNDPARLAAAAVQEFIQAQPPDTHIGIVLFSDAVELVAPLTPVDDASQPALAAALARLDYRGQWTRTAGAVERALYELRVKGRAEAQRALVLVTDGLIDTGDGARDGELKAWLRGPLATEAQRGRVKIFGVAFTERADYELLQSLAAGTGGDYFRVLEAGDLAPALQRIEDTLAAVATTRRPPLEAAQAPPPAAATASPPPVAPASDRAAPPPPAGRLQWWLGVPVAAVAVVVLVLLRRRRAAAAPAPVAAPWEPPGPQAVLVDLNYPTGPRRYPVSHRPVVIGRKAGSDRNQDYVVVPEKTVGRWHATIFRQGQSFTIRDENSVNGTFVNNERIHGEHPLRHSDIVRVHGHSFEFLIPDLAGSESTVLLPGR